MPKHTAQRHRAGFLVFLPRATPDLTSMLADIGQPSAQALASALGVASTTARRWMREGTAPRSVLLALFYVTQWGRSDVNCRAENDARTQAALAFCLRAELDKANAQLARLGLIGEFGSANDPSPASPTQPGAPAAKVSPAQENRRRSTAETAVSHRKPRRFSQSN